MLEQTHATNFFHQPVSWMHAYFLYKDITGESKSIEFVESFSAKVRFKYTMIYAKWVLSRGLHGTNKEFHTIKTTKHMLIYLVLYQELFY